MKGLFLLYLVFSVVEYVYYISATSRIDKEVSRIPAGDLEYHNFSYPSDKVLMIFFPAYIVVRLQIFICNAL